VEGGDQTQSAPSMRSPKSPVGQHGFCLIAGCHKVAGNHVSGFSSFPLSASCFLFEEINHHLSLRYLAP